jgi:hypothetical protein
VKTQALYFLIHYNPPYLVPSLPRGDNFSPRMPCQWYVRGGGEGKRRILIGQSVPPTPFGMAFGRLKLSPQATDEQRMTTSVIDSLP